MRKLITLGLTVVIATALVACTVQETTPESEATVVKNQTDTQTVETDEIKVETDDTKEKENVEVSESSTEIVGDARKMTEEELEYFNTNYFNKAYGEDDNLSIANQILHSTFEKPQDIDLHQWFYLGPGFDFQLDDTGECDSVAQAYGFKDWSEIPTDVSPIELYAIENAIDFFTNTSFDESNKVGLENFKYLEEYERYYNLHGDTNYYGDVEFTNGYIKGDTATLEYTHYNGQDYILTLIDEPDDSREKYYIVSNLPK